MGETPLNVQNKSTEELEDLKSYYSKLHKQAVEAYRSDNVKEWDEKAKEYMEKIREINNELYERQN